MQFSSEIGSFFRVELDWALTILAEYLRIAISFSLARIMHLILIRAWKYEKSSRFEICGFFKDIMRGSVTELALFPKLTLVTFRSN